MKLFHILLAEDNEGDIILIEEAIAFANIQVKLSTVKDGKAVIDFLNKEGNYPNIDLPDLLILDINLPKKNGHEVLKYIKEHKSFKCIPVTIFTTSSSDRDIKMCYDNYANCFITKPSDVNEFLRVVASLIFFWMNTAGIHERKTILKDVSQNDLPAGAFFVRA